MPTKHGRPSAPRGSRGFTGQKDAPNPSIRLEFPTEPVSRLRPKRGIEFCTALLGTCIVLAAVLFVPPPYLLMQTIVTVVGILILQVGVWSLTRQVRVGERRFVLLREETQHFLRLVPALNASAVGIQEGVEEEKECFQATLKRMRASVTRMSEVAGEDNLPPVERNVG